MSDIALDEDGDIAQIDGDLSILHGIDAIKQNIDIRLSLFLGEWFLDTSRGIPYFESILIKNPSFEVVSSIFKTTILDTLGVTELSEFAIDYTEERILTTQFKVKSIDGDINFVTQKEV